MGKWGVLETVGWIVFGLGLAGALLLLNMGGPDWLLDTLMWGYVAVMVPLLFLDSRRRWREMSGYAVVLGPIRFWALLAGTVLLILLLAGADMWLSDKIGWPEAYGFNCMGRGCWLNNLSHSPKLLRGGSAYELGLFALLWLLTAFLVGCAIYAIFRRRHRNPIRPMD